MEKITKKIFTGKIKDDTDLMLSLLSVQYIQKTEWVTKGIYRYAKFDYVDEWGDRCPFWTIQKFKRKSFLNPFSDKEWLGYESFWTESEFNKKLKTMGLLN